MQICEYLKNLNIFVYYIYQTNFNFMINNYDSVVACSSSGATSSQKQGETSYTSTKRAWLSFVTVFIALFSIAFVQGQSSANYVFSTGASTLNSMTGSTPVPGITAFPADFATSTVVPIGFNFLYMGNYYSHFNVNCDGQLRLHTNGSATAMPSSVSSYALNTVTIAPMGGDNETGTGISYLVSGTAPNRKLIIEWNNFYANWTDPQTSGNMQLVLNETTGVIEFLYGNILNSSTSSVSKSIFHSSSNTANASAFITVGATPTVNTTATSPTTNSFAASVQIANLSNNFYKFTPSTPASGPTGLVLSAATASTMTLNWTAATDLTNVVRYVVLSSADGGVTYNFVANVATSATTYAATGLTPGTTYDWKVVAVSEGVESTPATGSLATAAAATYYWVGTSSSGTPGAFATLTNWNTAANGTGTAPAALTSTDVFIVDGDGSSTTGGNVFINFAASTSVGQFKVTNGTAATLQATTSTARTITVTGGPGFDFMVEFGSTLNLTNANAIGFAFTGTDNTGLMAGTYNTAGSNSNRITTTGGTRTVLTVPSTGVVNNAIPDSSGCLTGSTATLIFGAGSNYTHSSFTTTSGLLPLATWDATSNILITGGTTSTGLTNPGQTFGNFTYNSATSTGTMSAFTSNTTVIQGNLTIINSNTGKFRALTLGTLTVNGNLVVDGGTFEVASTSGTVRVLGNVVQNAGRIEVTTGTSTFNSPGLLVAGQFNQVGGALLQPVLSTNHRIEFNGTTAQSVAFNGTTNGPVIFRVNNPAGISLATDMQINTNGSLIVSNGNVSGTGNVVYNSTHGYLGSATAASSTTTITVASTVGLQPGMTLTMLSGTGVFAANTTVSTITNATTFTVSTAPTTALAIGAQFTGALTGVTRLNYNSTTGAQTANAKEFPAVSGPTSLIINNTATAPNNVVNIPFDRTLEGTAGTLALTAGMLDNSTYTLTVPNTATAAITGGSATSYVKGALARSIPASLASAATYAFPVGKSGINAFELVNPTTTASGTVTVKAEVFDAATGGTAGSLLGGINSNKYWAASITNGGANLTNTFIKLNDAPSGADAIGASATLTGAYALVGGLNATITATSITTTTPALTSLAGYFVMGTRATPVLSNLVITPIGNRCPNVARTVTVDVAQGAGAITNVDLSYSINGGTPVVVAMTNTSGSSWSGTIPTVTPANATVTWSVTATDNNLLTKTQAGTTFTDGGLNTAVITITPSVPSFCGVGGSVTLTASSTIPGVVYTWQSLTPGVTLSGTSGTSTSATIAETSNFKVTGTPNDGGCPSEGFISVGVYELPSATVTTSASGVCPGTSATIGSGLTAGNFTVASIPYSATTAPSNAVTIMNNGTALIPLAGGTMDDGGWSNIPLGFNFNYFGNSFSTISAGTNGLLMFGTPPGFGTGTGELGQFSFSGPPYFPNTSNPGNIIALLAADMQMANSTNGSIKYWTEGYAPNRTFVIEYRNVHGWSSNPKATVQCRLNETIGTVEIHIFEKSFSNSAIVGLQDATKTIGAVAPGRAGGTWTVSTPEAWKFIPPANYNTTWTATDANGTTTIASGTNIFSQSVSPAITTTYSISYTNQTTGCTNAAGSAQVVMDVLSNTPPASVSTIATSNSICFGDSVGLSLSYTGSTDGLVFQWQSSIDNGTSWQDIASATATSLTVTPTVATRYRCKMIACGGTPGYSSVSSVVFTNAITGTTPATRCGTGTATINALANAGAVVNWYAAATGEPSLGTGVVFTTPSISTTTTYYAAAVTSSAGTVLGAGATNSSSTGASFLPGGWGGTKTQYVIRASELIAAGLSAGPISSLGFEPTDSGQAYQGFNIRIGHTTNTTAPNDNTFVPNSGLSFVYAGTEADAGFTPVANRVNYLNFGTGSGTSAAFNWDGTSNIVVSISWSRVPGAFTATGTTLKGDNVGYVATAFRQRDNITPAEMANETAFFSSSSVRPRFIFNGFVCASPRVPVVVTVNPAPALTLSSSSAAICNGGATSAVTIATGASNYNNYVWTPSTGVSGNSTTGWTFNPTATTTYTLTASQSGGSLCATTATFTANVNALPTTMSITPASPSVCVNQIQSLSVNGGTLGVNGKIGAGTATNTTSTPFKGFWGGSKTQALYTATELSALGVTPGMNITSIGYKALSGTPLVLNDFTVQAGLVSDTTLGSDFIAGASNSVFGPVNYTPTTGNGDIDFPLSTPIVWDGVSSLLVETCFNNNNGGGSIANSISIESTIVPSGLNLYRTQDFSVDVCSNADLPSSTTTRPNLRVNALFNTRVVWSPVTDLYTDAAATIPYVANTNASTVYVKPSSVNPMTIVATSTVVSTGCVTTASVTVEDTTAPVVVTRPFTLQLDATGNATLTAAQVDNGSSDNCSIATMTVSPNTFTCANVGPNTVTLTVTDASGNSSSRTAVVTVRDQVGPTVVTQPVTVQLSSAGTASITAAQVNNSSTDACGIASISVSPNTFTCANLGANTVTLTVTDVNGNTSTGTAVVTVTIDFTTALDNDLDGTPDNCDPDDDNDGVLDSNDNCQFQANANQADNDADGLGDACDNDDDNDGVLDGYDNCQFTANPGQEDIDNDGMGDICDTVEINVSEAITPDGDGVNDTWFINNIQNYPNNSVKVYNRWGDLIFSRNSYQNDWNGSYSNNGSNTPDASSYYYQIDLDGNGSIDYDGWIYITK